jgi:hypothetical protein
MLRSFENAQRLLACKERDAFDLALGKRAKSRSKKLRREPLGRGCLLASWRLVENGARSCLR